MILFSEQFLVVLRSVGEAISLTWWFVLPVVLAVTVKDLWLVYVRKTFINKINWVTLEVKVPKEIMQTPRAMEEVFSTIYAMYSYGINFYDTWFEGKVERWVSFEVMGKGGGFYFYIRTPDAFKNLIEAAVYGQFHNVEIEEVPDYLEHLPEVLPNKTYDLWGTEMELVKDNSYPIKTYPKFEADIEERRIDPISTLAEVMSRLKEDEYILIQIMVSPVGKATKNDLSGEGKKTIDEVISGKKENKGGGMLTGLIEGFVEFLQNLALAFFREPVWSEAQEEGEKDKKKSLLETTSGSHEIIKGIENKLSKLSFETTLRIVYIDRQDGFSPLNISALMGYFHQFNTQNMNGFKPIKKTLTVHGSLLGRVFPRYKKYRVGLKKMSVYKNFRERTFGESGRIRKEKRPVLSTEELATLYHFPIINVEAPSLRRLPSRKGEPPLGLPLK